TLTAHHPKKGVVLPGQAARGSGALPASVDIIIEIHRVSRRVDDRRRRLRCESRYEETPRRWVMEWTADGKDYRPLGTTLELDQESGWLDIQAGLNEEERPLSRADLL